MCMALQITSSWNAYTWHNWKRTLTPWVTHNEAGSQPKPCLTNVMRVVLGDGFSGSEPFLGFRCLNLKTALSDHGNGKCKYCWETNSTYSRFQSWLICIGVHSRTITWQYVSKRHCSSIVTTPSLFLFRQSSQLKTNTVKRHTSDSILADSMVVNLNIIYI